MNTKSKILLTLGLIGMCLTIISTVSAEDSYVIQSSEVLTTDTISPDCGVGGCINDTDNTIDVDFTGELVYVNHTVNNTNSVNHTVNNTNSTDCVDGSILVNDTKSIEEDTNSTGVISGHQYTPAQENYLRGEANEACHYYSCDECVDIAYNYAISNLYYTWYYKDIVSLTSYSVGKTCLVMKLRYYDDWDHISSQLLIVDRFTGECKEYWEE